jgi:hypothetical protein
LPVLLEWTPVAQGRTHLALSDSGAGFISPDVRRSRKALAATACGGIAA